MPASTIPASKRAFTLVELAIVLVILGLIVGGVLTGQSLIRNAQLRGVTSEYNRYQTALASFRDKYFALPGDMANATAFWGTAGTCPGTVASTTATTCNGNGDGLLDPANAGSNEIFRAWQHLANAGLVEGLYSGVSADGTAADPAAVIGTNIPGSRLNGVGWTFMSLSTYTVSSTSFFEGDYGTILFLGAPITGNVSYGPGIKPEDAWNIDNKLDDGKPATGKVVSMERDGGVTSTACSDTAASGAASEAASKYVVANTGLNCALIFKLGL